MKILPAKGMYTNLKHNFVKLDSALDGLGPHISKIRPSIYAILAAILHLGNVNFNKNDQGYAQINKDDDSNESIQYASDQLKIESSHLERVLLQRTITVSSNQEDLMYYV